jgi:hypothetical protein
MANPTPSYSSYPSYPSYPQYPQSKSSVPQQFLGQIVEGVPGGPAYGEQAQLVPVDPMFKLEQMIKKYNINPTFVPMLRDLDEFDVVLLLDDSGSMNTGLKLPPGSSVYAKKKTRWQELAESTAIVIDIASSMDDNGIDVYFMNRGTLSGVTDFSQISQFFSTPAAGFTPTNRVLQQIMADRKKKGCEKKALIVICTDGTPTDDNGDEVGKIDELKTTLKNRKTADENYVTFRACTDNSATLSYLNSWDKELDRVDVISDYATEKAEVQACQGKDFQFEFPDYVIKMLLGGINDDMDKLDEKKL